jgi:hypothetical protein
MSQLGRIGKGQANLLEALAVYDYLTAEQATKLCLSEKSLGLGRKNLKALGDMGLVFALGGRALNLPLIYTLTAQGRHYVSGLGTPTAKRVRPKDEREKAGNIFSCGIPWQSLMS